MHSNVAQILSLLLEFPLLTLNRQIMAPRPEMCKIEKAVVLSRHYLCCEYCRLKTMLLPIFTNLPAYSSSPLIIHPRVGQSRYSPYYLYLTKLYASHSHFQSLGEDRIYMIKELS